jgi:hypothetical protein
MTYQNQLIENGWPSFPTSEYAKSLVLLHFLLYLIGTAATLYFMVKFVGGDYKSLKDQPPL